jgi:pimeloyl-ACP methyl ester carboxylesterase
VSTIQNQAQKNRRKHIMRNLFLILIGLVLSSSISAQSNEWAKNTALKVIDHFQQKQYDSIYVLFDDKMKQAMTAEQLHMIWDNFESNDGKYQKHGAQKESKFQQYLLIETAIAFEKKSYIFRLAFNDKKEVSGLFFVPMRTAQPRTDNTENEFYKEEDIKIKNGSIALPGTLCTPKSTQDYPIVVLIHGSGPQDRDVTIGPNKIFANIAHELAKKGIASIRYDKRTYVKSTSQPDLPTDGFEEVVINDALAAVHLALRTVPQENHVFLIGHSLGASLAPRIASHFPELGGVIMMAGIEGGLEDEVLRQTKYLLKKDGFKCKERKEYRAMKKRVKNVRRIDEFLAMDSVPDLPLVSDTSFWRDAHHMNAINDLKGIRIPVFILQGERDYQVTMESYENFMEAIEGKKNIEYKSYPKLNHLFHEGEGKSYPEEYQVAGNIPPYVLSDIALWILSKN